MCLQLKWYESEKNPKKTQQIIVGGYDAIAMHVQQILKTFIVIIHIFKHHLDLINSPTGRLLWPYILFNCFK